MCLLDVNLNYSLICCFKMYFSDITFGYHMHSGYCNRKKLVYTIYIFLCSYFILCIFMYVSICLCTFIRLVQLVGINIYLLFVNCFIITIIIIIDSCFSMILVTFPSLSTPGIWTFSHFFFIVFTLKMDCSFILYHENNYVRHFYCSYLCFGSMLSNTLNNENSPELEFRNLLLSSLTTYHLTKSLI
uniref:SJCHGC03269 protein n=1 Tax=Schistosoma japonicum TaxID=6182 RepID=Q5D9B6_SCHJA|nr:SJCHGC03269 protein [Schistosoma japonicum]